MTPTHQPSETPRTDAIWKPKKVPAYVKEGQNFIYEFADNCRDTEYDFACTLEKELAVAKAVIRQYEQQNIAVSSAIGQPLSAKPLALNIKELSHQLATANQENLKLRAGLKKAHDAMFSWFSSEYANHPLTKEIGGLLC